MNLILCRWVFHIVHMVPAVFDGGQKAFKVTRGLTEDLVNLICQGINPIYESHTWHVDALMECITVSLSPLRCSKINT